MPTIYREGSFQVVFYSRDRKEPPHVHVKADGNEAKFWLSYGDPPGVELARTGGFAEHEVRKARRMVEANREYLLNEWHDYFNS